MVKLCTDTYPTNSEYECYFQDYKFPLSDFQKYAIEAIVEKQHILITAHTGSGKTLPAEFAIEHFVAQGKKVIYTSPIKALSNQKFHEFSKKFPHISFGILTGDIKFNPEADVLIMTTEILRNTLLQKNVDKKDDSNKQTSGIDDSVQGLRNFFKQKYDGYDDTAVNALDIKSLDKIAQFFEVCSLDKVFGS